MSKAAAAEIEGSPPQCTVAFHGHRDVEATLLSAYRSGRLHHAVMLAGPPGIGKATLAFRFARFLLEHPDPGSPAVAAADDLGVAEDSRTFRLVARLAHPDLVVLDPDIFEDESKRRDIKVEHVRWAMRKLASASDSGGWRVAIVDAADDLNRAAANALLKGLEEPGANTIFLLVANLPGRLMPTIRSRCLRLEMAPLAAPDFTAALEAAAAGALAGDEVDQLWRVAHGSPGGALRIAGAGGLELEASLAALVASLPELDLAMLHGLADRLAPAAAGERFELFVTLYLDWLAAAIRARARAGEGGRRLEPWLELWEKVGRAVDDTLALNLDRKQLILTAFFDLEAAARGSALS